MQRNSGKMRIIKNIIILLIMLMTVITIYYNIRNSKAESTFELTINLDKNTTEQMEIKTTAYEKGNGTYSITLPKWKGEFGISKYLIKRKVNNISTGKEEEKTIEIPVTGENTQTDITLTENEIKNKKIEMTTKYDTKEVQLKLENGENTYTATETIYNKKVIDTENNLTVQGYMLKNGEAHGDCQAKIQKVERNIVQTLEYNASIWEKVDFDSLTKDQQKVYQTIAYNLFAKDNGDGTYTVEPGTKSVDGVRVVVKGNSNETQTVTYYNRYDSEKYNEELQMKIELPKVELEGNSLNATVSQAILTKSDGSKSQIAVNNNQINDKLYTGAKINITRIVEIKNIFIGKQGTEAETNKIKTFGQETKQKLPIGTHIEYKTEVKSGNPTKGDTTTGIFGAIGGAAGGALLFGVPGALIGAIGGAILGFFLGDAGTSQYIATTEITVIDYFEYTPFLGFTGENAYITQLTRENISSINFTSSIPEEYTIGYSVAETGIVNVYWIAETGEIYIYSPGKTEIQDASYLFEGCLTMTNIDFENAEGNLTGAKYMFNNCQVLTGVNLNNFNFRNVTDSSYMFNNCQYINSIDIENAIFADSFTADYMFEGVGTGEKKEEGTNIYTNNKYWIDDQIAKYPGYFKKKISRKI